MFFIGIFGIEHREKIIKEINNLTCKRCLQNVTGKLVKQYDYCSCVFKVSKEKGKSIEHDNDIEINYWDLKEEENTWREKICPGCGREVDSQYSYCPYCGNRIK